MKRYRDIPIELAEKVAQDILEGLNFDDFLDTCKYKYPEEFKDECDGWIAIENIAHMFLEQRKKDRGKES